MISRYFRKTGLMAALALLLHTGELAAEPAQISIQGKLQNAAGAPLVGTRAYRVRFFNASTAGTQLGANVTGNVSLSSAGRFSIILTPPTQILNQNTVYYELAIDSAATPDGIVNTIDTFPNRIQVTSVPFARNAGQLGGLAASSYAKTSELNSVPFAVNAGHLGGTSASLYAQLDDLNRVPFAVNAGQLGGTSASLYAKLSDLNSVPFAVNAGQLGGLAASNYAKSADITTSLAQLNGNAWHLGGNAITSTTQFLGTTNNVPLELRAGNQRVGLLEAGDSVVGGNLTLGHRSNKIVSGFKGSVIGGGTSNEINGHQGTIAGGKDNRIRFDAQYGTIGGGTINDVDNDRATVGGGQGNQASGENSTVGGGFDNDAKGWASTIAGGEDNRAIEMYSTVAGGSFNRAEANGSTVGGGESNQILLPDGDWSTISGGRGNSTRTGSASTIGGGMDNVTSNLGSTIPGGVANEALGDYSFAAGRSAKADHEGAFVWADSTNSDFASTAMNQFLIRATGGVGINKTSPTQALDVEGSIAFSGDLKGKAVRAEPATGLRLIRGVINGADGAVSSGEGFTSSRVGTGIYAITYTTPFTGNPAATFTAHNSTDMPLIALVNSSGPLNAQVRFFDLSGVLTDPVFFHFTVVGP